MYYVVWNPYPNMKLWTVPTLWIETGVLLKGGFTDYNTALIALEICQKETSESKPQFNIVFISNKD